MNLTSIGKTKFGGTENGHALEVKTTTEKSIQNKFYKNNSSQNSSYRYHSTVDFRNVFDIGYLNFY